MNWATMRYLVEGRGGEFGMLKDQAILDALWPTLLSDPANWAGCNGPMLGLTQDASADDFSEPAGGWYWADGTPLDQEWGAVASRRTQRRELRVARTVLFRVRDCTRLR